MEAKDGFQLRYIFFLERKERQNLTVAEIPFSKIAELGAAMYRGKPRGESINGDALGNQPGEGGSIPTSPLIDATPATG